MNNLYSFFSYHMTKCLKDGKSKIIIDPYHEIHLYASFPVIKINFISNEVLNFQFMVSGFHEEVVIFSDLGEINATKEEFLEITKGYYPKLLEWMIWNLEENE